MPLGQAVAEEGIASSSSLEEEIDKFQFEEEETQGVEAIVILEAEEEIDEYSCVQTPAPIVTYVEDSSDNEVEEMAPKSGKSLRELMKGRNVVPTPQEANKSKGELMGVFDVHEINTIKYSHIYIFSLTFMLFCD